MLEFLEDIFKPVIFYKSCKFCQNVFSSISDLFYRENFHSDIISYYLSYELPKRKLIEWINKQKQNDELLFENYKSGEIIREDAGIDIILYSYDKEKAIIIENKSNNAGDQYKQLPRYVNLLKKRNIDVKAILYLNKSHTKQPDKTGWELDEIELIDSKLVSTQLIGANSFVSNVIEKTMQESNDIRLSGLSHEIKCLFIELIYGGINMEDLTLFIKELLMNDNLDKLKKTISAYNDLPKYWREYYKMYFEQLRNDGKIKKQIQIGSYQSNCLFLDNFIIDNTNYGFDIWFTHEYVDYWILSRDKRENDIEKLKEKMGNDWKFGNECTNERYHFKENDPFNEEKIKRTCHEIIISFHKFIN